MDLNLENNDLLVLALVLIAGIIFGKLVYRFKMPGITGQILAGVIIGPYVLNIFSVESLHHFEPITEFALGLIAVTIGSHLNYRKLHNSWKRMVLIVTAEALFVPLFIFIPLYFIFKLPMPVAAIISAIALETSPASIIHIIKEQRAKGLFCKTLVSEVALNNVVCLLLFEVALTVAIKFIGIEGVSDKTLPFIVLTLVKLVASLLLGMASGALLIFLTKKVKLRSNLFSLSLIAMLLISGIGQMFTLPPLLAHMVLGVIIGNFADKNFKIVDAFESIEYVIFACFFTIAGAHLNFESLKVAGVVGIVYILLRAAGKIVGPMLVNHFTKSPKVITHWLGVGLMPQAGMSIGLVIWLQQEPIFADYISVISTIVLTAVFLNESIGPLFTGLSIKKSGECNKDRLRLIEFLHEEFIKVGLKADNKWDAIEELTDFLVTTHHIEKSKREEILNSIVNRERELSTAIGEGIAIPHGSIEVEEQIMGVLGICPEGIDFDSPDGEPVKLIVLILTPRNHYDKHIMVLAGIARIFGGQDVDHEGVKEMVFKARSAAEVYEILNTEEMDEHNYFLDED